jgi:hypothetical protein
MTTPKLPTQVPQAPDRLFQHHTSPLNRPPRRPCLRKPRDTRLRSTDYDTAYRAEISAAYVNRTSSSCEAWGFCADGASECSSHHDRRHSSSDSLPPKLALDLRQSCESHEPPPACAQTDPTLLQPLLHAAVFLLQMAAVSLLTRKFNSYYAQRPGRRQHPPTRVLYLTDMLVLTTMITNAVRWPLLALPVVPHDRHVLRYHFPLKSELTSPLSLFFV